jgi:hypothetical protein
VILEDPCWSRLVGSKTAGQNPCRLHEEHRRSHPIPADQERWICLSMKLGLSRILREETLMDEKQDCEGLVALVDSKAIARFVSPGRPMNTVIAARQVVSSRVHSLLSNPERTLFL